RAMHRRRVGHAISLRAPAARPRAPSQATRSVHVYTMAGTIAIDTPGRQRIGLGRPPRLDAVTQRAGSVQGSTGWSHHSERAHVEVALNVSFRALPTRHTHPLRCVGRNPVVSIGRPGKIVHRTYQPSSWVLAPRLARPRVARSDAWAPPGP